MVENKSNPITIPSKKKIIIHKQQKIFSNDINYKKLREGGGHEVEGGVLLRNIFFPIAINLKL